MAAPDPSLQRSIDAVAVPGVLVAHRRIAAGDEQALLPAELAPLAASVVKVRRASGAARIVARGLLPTLGAPAQAILRSANGVPVWPEGVVGSLAHDPDVAVAAVARSSDFLSVGIDVEPAEPIDAGLVDMVATAAERRVIGADLVLARALFSIKEAIYKAVYPLDGVFLDHHDVEISLDAGMASIKGGRQVSFRYGRAGRIVALAYIRV